MKKILLFLLGLLACLAALTQLPLKVVVAVMRIEKFGLTARAVDGNLWSGHLYDAKAGKIVLGDITSRMSLADLLNGRILLTVAGSDPDSHLKGGFSYGIGGIGVEDLSVSLPAVQGAPMLPPFTLAIDGLSARFPHGECSAASGSTHTYYSGSMMGSTLPDVLSGPALCRDGWLVLDLATANGHGQEQFIIRSVYRCSVHAVIRTATPALAAQLQVAGFVAGADGFVYDSERTL